MLKNLLIMMKIMDLYKGNYSKIEDISDLQWNWF